MRNFMFGLGLSLVAGLTIAAIAMAMQTPASYQTLVLVSVAFGLGNIVQWIKAQADE